MKNIFLFLLISSCWYCTGNDHPRSPEELEKAAQKDKEEPVTDTSTHETQPGNNTAGESPSDTIIWVGLFARWDLQPGEFYDGSYDTASTIFVLCSNERSVLVPRDQITFQTSGNCDTASEYRIKLFKKVNKDSVKVIANHLQIDRDKGVFETGQRKEYIKIPPKTIERIKRNALIKSTVNAQVKTVQEPVKKPFIALQDTLKVKKITPLLKHQ